MSIELPVPGGEHAGLPVQSGERTGFVQSPEVNRAGENVENKSTERPASQEVRTTSGGGNPYDTNSHVVADDTTQASPTVSTTAPASLDDIPVVAADEDLIEKQWVDSVKRVIRETRNDPYKQGEAISRLQADYLQKRYGKTIGQTGGA